MLSFWDRVWLVHSGLVRDYFREREEQKKRWDDFCKQCMREIVEECTQITSVIDEAVSKQAGDHIHKALLDGIVQLPLYGFYLDLSHQIRITKEQDQFLELFFSQVRTPYSKNTFINATAVNSDVRSSLLDLVGISQEKAGSFWVQYFKVLYRTDEDTTYISKVIDSFSSITMRFAALSGKTEEYLLVILEDFIKSVHKQAVLCRQIPDDDIDFFGDASFKEHYEKYKEDTYKVCRLTMDENDEDLNPTEFFKAFTLGIIYQVVRRCTRNRADKIRIIDDVLSQIDTDSNVDGDYIFKYMEDKQGEDTTMLAYMMHTFTDIEDENPVGWIMLSRACGTYNLETKKDIRAVQEAINFIIGMENFLSDKYSMSGFGHIASDYSKKVVDIINDDLDTNVTIVEKEIEQTDNMEDVKKNIDKDELIGRRVLNVLSNVTGIIEGISDGYVEVDHHGQMAKYAYPAAFAGTLEIEDEEIQERMAYEGRDASFERVKTLYSHAVGKEIEFLRVTGGKRYRIIDGEKVSSSGDGYLYAFDTDTDLNFPDGTAIKLHFPEKTIPAYVLSCEDFTLIIRTYEFLGETVQSVEFTAEQWLLLEALMDRIREMDPSSESLAYKVAIEGKKQISKWQGIVLGQNYAFNRATSEDITFIWGPPGTGKTETLANIALEHIRYGRRILMLSYSNVSVDGALLRVAKKDDFPAGVVIRYGYPRMKEVLESRTLTSYQYALYKNPSLALEYYELTERKKRLGRKDPERVAVNKRLNKIRDFLHEQEKEIIQNSAFVATTVSKALVDRAVYTQRFDVVIFDEASMAYVPQIVFSAGLAKSFFVCLGDFCQLPAIVQNNNDDQLTRDIFEYTGITTAVENDQGHNWLVMLNVQYRMHRDIADFVSEHMYGGRLETSERIDESRAEISLCNPCPELAMSMIDLGGMYSVCTKTMDGSRINVLSALICLRLAEMNIDKYEIGIIAPYSAQSRLILAMVRDMQEHNDKWMKVSCATVHQFQGSEEPIIIYDAVDCYRMPYPGVLLTSLKHNTANRLFNVAITRTKGKFVLVANGDYLKRKRISKNLLFTNAMDQMSEEKSVVRGAGLFNETMPLKDEDPYVHVGDRKNTWDKFIEDVHNAKTRINIDIPDVIDEDDEAVNRLISELEEREKQGVNICIRISEDIDLPAGMTKYARIYPYITNPVTIIDRSTIWFGQPIYAADFISEGDIINTEYFPCIRFIGSHAARSLQAFLEM